jgi:hypothetical protein
MMMIHVKNNYLKQSIKILVSYEGAGAYSWGMRLVTS